MRWLKKNVDCDLILFVFIVSGMYALTSSATSRNRIILSSLSRCVVYQHYCILSGVLYTLSHWDLSTIRYDFFLLIHFFRVKHFPNATRFNSLGAEKRVSSINETSKSHLLITALYTPRPAVCCIWCMELHKKTTAQIFHPLWIYFLVLSFAPTLPPILSRLLLCWGNPFYKQMRDRHFCRRQTVQFSYLK